MPPSIDRQSTAEGAGQYRFRLTTLSHPAVALVRPDGQTEPLPAVQSKHLAALTYIALSPGRMASRQVLSALLWAESKDRDPRHGLRASLNFLRGPKGLGSDTLSSGDRESVALTVPVEVDCEHFESLVNAGRFHDAVRAYSGRFFANWSAPGAEGFEDWAAGKRQHYSSLFSAAAVAAATELLSLGNSAAAVRIAEQLRSESPNTPGNWALLLEARLAARDRVRAIADADLLDQLERNGDIELDATLRALMRRCRTGVSVAPDVSDADTSMQWRPEMVGREREFSALLSAWERAESGRVSVISLQAPAGLGKTRLLEEFASRLRSMYARPATVVEVGGNIVNRSLEFGLAARLALAIGSARGASGISGSAANVLAGLEPSLSNVFRAATPLLPPAHDAVRIRASALGEIISAVAVERRLAILIDDAQWSDALSRQVIAAALSHLRGIPLLVVIASRSGSPVDLPSDTVVELPPLSAAAIHELCRSIAEFPDDPWTEDLIHGLHRSTRGSPFVIVQTLAHFGDRDILSVHDGTWHCHNRDALQSLADTSPVVAKRIGARPGDELRLLLVIGAAAGSLSAADISDIALEHCGGDAALRELERHGIVQRFGGTYRVAHDELLTQAEDHAGTDMWRHARLLVAEKLLARMPEDADALREAGSHFYAAHDAARTKELFRRFVMTRRAHGDPGSAAALAHAFVADADPDSVSHWTRALPFSQRHPSRWRVMLATPLVAAAAALAWVVTRPPAEPPPHAYAWVLLSTGSAVPIAAESIAIRESDVQAGKTFEVGRRPQIQIRLPGRDLGEVAINPLNPRQWISGIAVADSGVTDLFIVDSGVARRITFARGDDTGPSWSPDGHRVLFRTARWDSLGRTSLAILDLRSNTVQRVTDPGGATDLSASWSPDGSAIAFARQSYSQGTVAVCIAAADGLRVRCENLAAGEMLASDLAWSDTGSVVARVATKTLKRLVHFTAQGPLTYADDRDATLHMRTAYASGVTVAMDSAGQQVRLGFVGRPGNFIALSTTNGLKYAGLLAAGVPHAGRYIDTLGIHCTHQPVAGMPHQLATRAVDQYGRAVVPALLRWTLVDTAHATLSATGELLARVPGDYRVRVSAGGWRTTEARITVLPARDSLLDTEDWSGDPWERWRRFGEPFPRIDTIGSQPTLDVNGEGTFFSGVYSNRTYDAQHGLTLDVQVKAPITMGQGQLILFGFSSLHADSATQAWDHKTGWPILASSECYFHYPGGPDGGSKADFIMAGSGQVPAPRRLRDGRWFNVRLQLLPDGRCVTMLDGKVIDLATESMRHPGPHRVYFYGSTVRTALRVGRVEVHSESR